MCNAHSLAAASGLRFLPQVWLWRLQDLDTAADMLCPPVMVSAFGLAQPLFLALLLFIMQLRLTDLVDRYHHETDEQTNIGYRMVQEGGPPLVQRGPQLRGVCRRVSESILGKSALAILLPLLSQVSTLWRQHPPDDGQSDSRSLKK